MGSYTVVIEVEFVEVVEAKNPEEAEQVGMRLVNLSIGNGASPATVTNSRICLSPSQENKDAANPG